jgi:4-carboxymuconolactone decarboxylase
MMTRDNPRVAPQLVRETAPKLADITDDVLFADIWDRDELSARDRSLITVAALITLRNGVTREELAEVATHLAFYAGWPAGMSAVTVLADIDE